MIGNDPDSTRVRARRATARSVSSHADSDGFAYRYLLCALFVRHFLVNRSVMLRYRRYTVSIWVKRSLRADGRREGGRNGNNWKRRAKAERTARFKGLEK